MDESAVLNLFERHWFTKNPFFKKPTSLTFPSPPPTLPCDQNLQEPTISRLPSRHARSLSDDSNSKRNRKSINSFSPNYDLPSPKLATIVSGKVVEDVSMVERQKGKLSLNGEKARRLPDRTKKLSKSLSELEFDEIKGFMDLGFTFSEEEKDPKLVELLPGLQRLGRTGDNVDRTSVSRPYLSESWINEKPETPLVGLRLSRFSNGAEIKEQLRFWAHSVASAVR